MKTIDKQNFVQVKYDLLAAKELNSTQKLFITYIIGWQKNNLICKETNNNLALRFGMKNAGIRSLLRSLNKFDFFNAIKHDFDENTRTSGHDILVDEQKLEEFLSSKNTPNKTSKETISTEAELIDEVEILPEELKETHEITQYHDDDIIHIQDLMTHLEFNESDINEFKSKFRSTSVSFGQFLKYFVGLTLVQNKEDYTGVLISEEQKEKLYQMCIDCS